MSDTWTFRREVQDKLSVARGGRDPKTAHEQIVLKQCEDFLVEQHEARLAAEAAQYQQELDDQRADVEHEVEINRSLRREHEDAITRFVLVVDDLRARLQDGQQALDAKDRDTSTRDLLNAAGRRQFDMRVAVEAERDRHARHIDRAWAMLANCYDVESREECESSPLTHDGFMPLEMAIHAIHKRDPQVASLRSALEGAKYFIQNGVALGYIKMPDADCPDPAHLVLPAILEALGEKL